MFLSSMIRFELDINAIIFDNSIDVYIDGVLQPMIHKESLKIDTNLEAGEHTIKIQRSSMLLGKLWLYKVFLYTIIGFFGSVPPEFEKGKIFNALFEAKFVLKKDTYIQMILTNDLDNPYSYDFDGFTVINNKIWNDKLLEKRRVIGRIAFVFFAILVFAAIAVVSTLTSKR